MMEQRRFVKCLLFCAEVRSVRSGITNDRSTLQSSPLQHNVPCGRPTKPLFALDGHVEPSTAVWVAYGIS